MGRLTALLPSIELARDELRRQGPTLDEKAVHRMARQLGAEVLATRTRDLRRWRDGRLPAGQEMVGQHVVAQTDGGRVRVRTRVEATASGEPPESGKKGGPAGPTGRDAPRSRGG